MSMITITPFEMSTSHHTDIFNAVTEKILGYLGLRKQAPDLRYLNRLISAYTRRVPWESVSRIVKRYTTTDTRDCPREPAEFWQDALRYGTGGTCYESSLAFLTLLESLGYRGYLTVNDMGETTGCHAASVVLVEGRKYLVDVTIPVHEALEILPDSESRLATRFHDYTLIPLGDSRYKLLRSHHSQAYIFTLIDKPVSRTAYRSILETDYTEAGHFLKSVVIVKVIGNSVWRFFSDHSPFRLERFNKTGKQEIPVQPGRLAATLAAKFGLPRSKVSRALGWAGILDEVPA